MFPSQEKRHMEFHLDAVGILALELDELKIEDDQICMLFRTYTLHFQGKKSKEFPQGVLGKLVCD
jgi:hypothetical protein